MPRGYSGPEVDEQQPVKSKTAPGGVPNPDTGMYRHAQYNSPLRMYSADNAKEAFNIQSGGNVDVSGLNNRYEATYHVFYTHLETLLKIMAITTKTTDKSILLFLIKDFKR